MTPILKNPILVKREDEIKRLTGSIRQDSTISATDNDNAQTEEVSNSNTQSKS